MGCAQLYLAAKLYVGINKITHMTVNQRVWSYTQTCQVSRISQESPALGPLLTLTRICCSTLMQRATTGKGHQFNKITIGKGHQSNKIIIRRDVL